MMDQYSNHSQRNTWRTLKELEPVQTIKCRLNWHLWTNWEVWDNEWAKGNPSHATCYCARCGMPRVEQPYSKSRKK